MTRTRLRHASRWATATATIAVLLSVGAVGVIDAGATPAPRAAVAQRESYVLDFVATAATAVAMNNAGDVVGTSRLDPGCGSACLPPVDPVVWRAGRRIVLPNPTPSLTPVTLVGINNQGWITGSVGFPGTTTHAVVWKPSGSTYTAIDIGNLPGKTIAAVAGIDDLNRVVGWSTNGCIGCGGAPFVWTETGGLVDLTTLGFPPEQPLGISPGGSVATCGLWYRLDVPGSSTATPAPPAGFSLSCGAVKINDAGDQARFLVTTSPEFLDYPFRFHHEGTWQQLSSIPTGHLSTAGVGSITQAGDITLTVAGAGMIAYGPDGLAQSLSALVSPSYSGSVLTGSGPMNASGQILAEMIIGQSGRRIVRLVPAARCTSSCMRVASIQIQAKGPGFCDTGRTRASATLTVTRASGVVQQGVRVTAHFFDDYWLDQAVTGKTNSVGQVTFKHVGPPCVGAIAILVTDAAKPGRAFDKTVGILTEHVIPLA